MSVTKKLKKAGLWQTINIVTQVLAQFGYLAIMARLLTKADFGLMALASSFIGFGTLFSNGGMGGALIQRQGITQKHMNAAFQSAMIIGLFFFGLFYIFSSGISDFFREPELKPMIRVAALNVILSSVGSVSISMLQKNFKFKIIAIVSTFVVIFSYGLGVLSAYYGYGVWSLVIASVVQSFLMSCFLFYFAPIKLSYKIHIKEWKELFSFGSGLMILRTLNYFAVSGLNLVLGRIFTPATLGVFERANKIKTLPSDYLGQIISKIMFPALSEIQDEKEKLFRIYQHSLGVVNSLLMPVALVLIIFSQQVVDLVLGSKWGEAIIPLQILFVTLPFASSGRMADSVIRAKGLIYKNVYRKLISVTVLILSTAIGGYFYGLTGAAIGVTISYLFDYTIMLMLVKNIFDKNISEIFLTPVISGFKLSLLFLILSFFSRFIFSSLADKTLLYFILNMIFIGTLSLLIFWKNRSLLGPYIQETIDKLLTKKKNKKNKNQIKH